ncbi:MAG: hypothetical protein ACRCZI_05330 [Cetobacterium sp.]
MLISRSISSLINGVSQQDDSQRLATQAEAQDNCHSSVVEGLSDRPPTQHIAKLLNGVIGDVYTHTINRDLTERYKVLIVNGDLFVFDLDGVPRTVAFPHGKTYLNTVTPSTSMKVLTVQDHSFVLNTEKITALDAAVTASRPKEALIFVKAGNYGSTYTVNINGNPAAQKVTSTTVVTDIATDVIAEELRSDLVTTLGAGWAVSRHGSVVHVSKNTGDFNITVTDSQGGASLLAFKDQTQTFTSLPVVAPTGFQLKIIGSEQTELDEYYVKFVPNTVGGTFGEGSWEETVGFGVQGTIDPANLPHLLIRENTGDFTFRRADWDSLTVGDSISAPAPSFIGHFISDLFFFKNRLGFLSGDNEIYSEIGGYFNFWPTTVTADIDSDPIDYKVSHTKVPILRHAVPFSQKLLLFSEQTQFIAQGTPTFTKKTLDTDPTTEFESSAACRPIGMGKHAYFVFNRGEALGQAGQFDGVREYFIDQVAEVKDAVEVTAQVPSYIPAGIFRLIPATTEDILVALTAGARHKMYMYKLYYVGEEKVQSAWYELTMGNPLHTKVLGAEFIGSILYLVMQRLDGVYLEKMNYAPRISDPFVNFVTHYDRRITDLDCTSITYNSGTNKTSWTLPYQIDGDLRAVTREINPGQIINLTYTSGTTIEATGDHSLRKMYFGMSYMRTFTFSQFFLREANKDGGETVVTSGRLQLRTCIIRYARTGTFTVTVSQDHRDPSNYVQFRDPSDSVFTGRVLGAGSNLLGAVALADGEFRFPILSENTKVTITVTTNSFLPMHLLGAEWEGFYHSRSRRG